MRFGFCSGFAVKPLFSLGPAVRALLPKVKEAGYDFVEFPLMSVEALASEEFCQLERQVRDLGLSCDLMCNLFPGGLSPWDRNRWEEDIAYLERAFALCRRLGTTKVVFGSGAFRTPPKGMESSSARGIFIDFCQAIAAPAARKHGITILIEPLNQAECAFINTVAEGAAMARAIDRPTVRLMADLYHMRVNSEPVGVLEANFDLIGHIHIAGPGRSLVHALDPYAASCLGVLRSCGYDKTASFETIDEPPLASPLESLKALLHR